jgi:hypothetical protein
MTEHSPMNRRIRLRIIGASLAASVIAAGLPVLAGTAQAATAASTPAIALTFASSTVESGTQPVMTYAGSNLPSGTVLYLQRGSAQGTGWKDVAQSQSVAGAAKIPASPPGSFAYRLVAVDGQRVVATSPDVSLTVAGASGSCGDCSVAGGPIPWLKQYVLQPIVGWVFGKVLDWIWGIFSD